MRGSCRAQVETAKDGHLEASRVAEVNLLEADVSLCFGEVELLATRVLGVDLGNRVGELDELGRRAACGAHVGDEREDVPGLDTRKDDTDLCNEEAAGREALVDHLTGGEGEKRAGRSLATAGRT